MSNTPEATTKDNTQDISCSNSQSFKNTSIPVEPYCKSSESMDVIVPSSLNELLKEFKKRSNWT